GGDGNRVVAATDHQALDAHVVAVAGDVVPGLRAGIDDLLGDELRASAVAEKVPDPCPAHAAKGLRCLAPGGVQVSAVLDQHLGQGSGQPRRLQQEGATEPARSRHEVVARANGGKRRLGEPRLPPPLPHQHLVAGGEHTGPGTRRPSSSQASATATIPVSLRVSTASAFVSLAAATIVDGIGASRPTQVTEAHCSYSTGSTATAGVPTVRAWTSPCRRRRG